jgi:rubrerythrin
MSENTALAVLKMALLLEKQGKMFYEQVAAQTSSEAVRDMFTTLAEEESRHVEVLSNRGMLRKDSLEKIPETLSRQILTKEVREQIGAASFEAAAISAAIEMENKSVSLYAERAEKATDSSERNLYRWLADWERSHQALLAGINKELIEKAWNDQGFWPF